MTDELKIVTLSAPGYPGKVKATLNDQDRMVAIDLTRTEGPPGGTVVFTHPSFPIMASINFNLKGQVHKIDYNDNRDGNLQELVIKLIKSTVCMHMAVPEDKIYVKTRKHQIKFTRQIVYYMLKEYTSMSLGGIGAICGQDHATVLNALRRVNNLRETEQETNTQLTIIEHEIEKRLGR